MEGENSGVLGKLDLQRFANSLRNESLPWQNARAEFDLIREVKPEDLGVKHKDYSEVSNVMIRARETLLRTLGSGMSALAQSSFIVDYDLRCNLLENAKYGAECIGLSFAIRWERSLVKIHYEHGNVSTSMLNGDLESFINSGRVGDLNKFAKCTGLQFDEVKNTKSSEVGTLLKIYQTVKRGHNKLARLVKGCLLYLDRCAGQKVIVDKFYPRIVKYGCQGLIDSYKSSGVAYVWNGDSDAMAYSIVLYSMCEEYPHPVFGGMEHISIPCDGNIVKMVSYQDIECDDPIEVTPEIIWGALVKYCDLMGISDDLEEAMIIACSLRENRYLTKVSLPAVVSNVDLVFPALADPKVSCSNQTRINLESAVVMGRVHQMMCLILVRDVDVCAHATSRTKEGVLQTVRSFISRDNWTLLNYMDDKTQVDLLKRSRSMVWMNYLTDNMITDMRKYSIFEAMWLIEYPQQVLRDGVIRCLKKGEKSPIGIHRAGLYFDAYSTLVREVNAGGCPGFMTMPDGGFNVRLSCIRGQRIKNDDISFEGEVDHPFEFQYQKEGCEDTAKNEDMMGVGWDICSEEDEEDDEWDHISEGDEEEEIDEDGETEEEKKAREKAARKEEYLKEMKKRKEEDLEKERKRREEEEEEEKKKKKRKEEDEEERKRKEEAEKQKSEKQPEKSEGDKPKGDPPIQKSEVGSGAKKEEKKTETKLSDDPKPRSYGAYGTRAGGVYGSPYGSSKFASKYPEPTGAVKSQKQYPIKFETTRVIGSGKNAQVLLPKIDHKGPAHLCRDAIEGFGTGFAPDMDRPAPKRGEIMYSEIRGPELKPEDPTIVGEGEGKKQAGDKHSSMDVVVMLEMGWKDFMKSKQTLGYFGLQMRLLLQSVDQEKYGNDKVVTFILDNDKRKAIVERCCEYFLIEKTLRPVPKAYKGLVNELLNQINSEVFSAMEDVKRGLVEDGMLKHIGADVLPTYAIDLRDVGHFNWKYKENKWWRWSVAGIYRKDTITGTSLSKEECECVSTYLDSGGSMDCWARFWRILGTDILMYKMNWHEVNMQWKTIKSLYEELKQKKVWEWRVPQEKAYTTICMSDSYTCDPQLHAVDRHKFNYWLKELVRMGRKSTIVLVQLLCSGLMIGDPELYCAAYRLFEMDLDSDARMRELLSSYIHPDEVIY